MRTLTHHGNTLKKLTEIFFPHNGKVRKFWETLSKSSQCEMTVATCHSHVKARKQLVLCYCGIISDGAIERKQLITSLID